jgi:hypothetical protein
MTAFTDHSIDLMEQLDEASGRRLRAGRGTSWWLAGFRGMG